MSSPSDALELAYFLIDSPPEIIQTGKYSAKKWIHLVNLYYTIKRQILQGFGANFHNLSYSTKSIIKDIFNKMEQRNIPSAEGGDIKEI